MRLESIVVSALVGVVSELQRVAVCCSMLQCVAESIVVSALVGVVSELQRVAVCCSVLQCVAVCSSALQLTRSHQRPHVTGKMFQKDIFRVEVSTTFGSRLTFFRIFTMPLHPLRHTQYFPRLLPRRHHLDAHQAPAARTSSKSSP